MFPLKLLQYSKKQNHVFPIFIVICITVQQWLNIYVHFFKSKIKNITYPLLVKDLNITTNSERDLHIPCFYIPLPSSRRSHYSNFLVKVCLWFYNQGTLNYGLSCGSAVKICLQCRSPRRCRFDPWVGKIPCRRKWQPTPVFLPGNSHGQRSLVRYSP